MNASIVDLRYKSREILAALEKRESITILYRGKPKGAIIPLEESFAGKVCEHEFFGMNDRETEPVDVVMKRLRGARHDL